MEISNQGIDQVLQQIRSFQSQVDAPQFHQEIGVNNSDQAFGELFSKTISQANEQLQESSQLKKAYDMGDESVSLIDVMIAGQKADVGLQATLQVRNRLLSAYQDIMNMPV